jgi:hypothetical protein
LGGTLVSPAIASWAAKFIAEEVSIYPPTMIPNLKLKRIVLCDQLFQTASHLSEKQREGGLYDYASGYLYMEARENESAFELRVSIHHELFHAIADATNSLSSDDGWSVLNPPGFHYSTSHLDLGGFIHKGFDGFVSGYAASAINEDKADTFSCMINDPVLIDQRIRNDPVLAAKVNWMKTFLKNFRPDLDANFWQRARKHAFEKMSQDDAKSS